MPAIGIPEMITVVVVILLLFGARILPELARGVGKSLGEFKKARSDFEREPGLGVDDARRQAASQEPAKPSEPD